MEMLQLIQADNELVRMFSLLFSKKQNHYFISSLSLTSWARTNLFKSNFDKEKLTAVWVKKKLDACADACSSSRGFIEEVR